MRPLPRILAGLVVLVVLMAAAAVAIGPLGWLGRDARQGSDPSPSVAIGVATVPASNPTQHAFADAYRTLAETHNREATDLLIANPLAEFDLVGTRLMELIDRTREGLTGLPAVAQTASRVHRVDVEMGATVALLRAIDPHGPPDQRATQYQRALDYWVEHVQPESDAIRAALGLPPSASGDLRL